MPAPEFPGNRLLRRLTAVPLHAKLVGMVSSAVFLIGLAITITVRSRLAHDLGLGLEERGVAIARDLASRSADLVLTENTFALYQLVRDTVESNPDVRYAFILDTNGQPLVHSFPQATPPDLLTVNRPASTDSYRLQPLDSEEGRLLDIAAPVLGGRAGIVRVGLSLTRLQAAITRATGELLTITALAMLLGALTAFSLTRLLTRPLSELVQMSRRVGEGDLSARARPHMDDEIGELGRAFNAMAGRLQESHAHLLSRLRELATLNAVANAISSTLGVQEVLQAALEKVLEVMDLQAGWVFLTDQNYPGGLKLTAQVNLSAAFAEEESQRELGQCVCVRVLESGVPCVVSDIGRECPRLSPQVIASEGLSCHASVPLIARQKVVGVFNVASGQSRLFLAHDLEILDSIGRQVGVAVENARLWEEVKEKEALRGQLLEKIIAAQEIERQRLSRELHDEAAQTLTALTLGLRALQDARTLSPIQRRTAENLKSLTTRLMQELHRLAVELRPSALDRVGLTAALEQHIREFEQRYPLEVAFETDSLENVILTPEIEISLYRIVQEALTNIARHAGASHVAVTLQARDGLIIATVDDDGRGFNPDKADKTSRLGLFGMQERATLIGGRCVIESVEGSGTSISVQIPLPRPISEVVQEANYG